ncbi:MAG: DsrE family protein [Gammaproteobacteria bacterium]|nr:DsrE family protein [Gammaproteobacteria bacterium]
MSNYLLIESRDPFECSDVEGVCWLAGELAQTGHKVTLFFLQNGALTARAGAETTDFEPLTASGVEVLVDDFALRERGIGNAQLADGIKPASLEVIVDHLADGSKVIWH